MKKKVMRHKIHNWWFIVGTILLLISSAIFFNSLKDTKQHLGEKILDLNELTLTIHTSINQLLTYTIIILLLIFTTWYYLKSYLIEKEDALLDHLTQVQNRRGIMENLEREISRANRYGESLTVALLDIDYFKKYNDTNGHVLGDKILREVAKTIESSTRKIDLVGRYGGEEFLVILPKTKRKQAWMVCERIRKAVEKRKFEGEEKLPNERVTLSIGVSEIPINNNPLTKEKLLISADKNLYKAKEQGRNRVI